MRRTALLAVLAIVAISVAALTVACESSRPVVPSTLTWDAPCVAEFECATVVAPLDYAQPLGETIELALIRHPAKNPGTRVGSLFFNPGGPGFGGTLALPVLLDHFPAKLVERFDIVSWDPRGIGGSRPVKCFDTKQEEEDFLKRLPDGFPVSPMGKGNLDWSVERLRYTVR